MSTIYSLTRAEMNGPKVFFMWKTTVYGPAVVVFATYGAKRYEKPWPIAMSLSIEKATSVEFRGSPLWKVTPVLRLNVYVKPSVDAIQVVARSGCSAPLGVGKTRLSYRLTSPALLASSDPFAGSATGTLANVRLSIWDDFVMFGMLVEVTEVVDEAAEDVDDAAEDVEVVAAGVNA